VVTNELPINGTLTMHVQVHMHKGKGGGEGSSTGACRYVYLIGKLRKLFTQAPVVQTQQNLFLVFIWQVLCLFRNHAIYLCHRESVSWQNGSVVSSAAWQCGADALEFESP